MSNIEDTKPIDALAARVWGGMRWYYPHIERMVADMKELRSENARLRKALEPFATHASWYDGSHAKDDYVPCCTVGSTDSHHQLTLKDFRLARQAVAGGGEKETNDA